MDHQVPIFIKELPEEQWDLTTQQVTPFIDGLNHVARIAALSDVDNNLVKACVQNLVYYGVVVMVPLFQYGNVYCTTPRLKLLAQNCELQVSYQNRREDGGGIEPFFFKLKLCIFIPFTITMQEVEYFCSMIFHLIRKTKN